MVDNADELNQLGQAARRFFNPGPTPIIRPRQQGTSSSASIHATNSVPEANLPQSIPVDRRRSSTWLLQQPNAVPTPSQEPVTPERSAPTMGHPFDSRATGHAPAGQASSTGAVRPAQSPGGAFRSAPTDKLIPELPGSTDRQIVVAGLLAGALFFGATSFLSGGRLTTSRASTPVTPISKSTSGSASATANAARNDGANTNSASSDIPVKVAGTSVTNPNADGSPVDPNSTNATSPSNSSPLNGTSAVDDDGFLLPTIPIPPEVNGTIGTIDAAPPASNTVYAPNAEPAVPTTIPVPLLTLDPGPSDPLVFENTKPFN